MGKNGVSKTGIRTIDLFCGAGGSSWGAKNAGCEIVAGFDLDEIAGEAFMQNHPDAWFYLGRLEEHDPASLRKELGQVDLILASPECTSHSPAKGSAPRCDASKATAFQVARFAREFEPRWIIIENVVSMRRWNRYAEFKSGLTRLGYHIREQVLNAADFGVPQARRRLFLLCDREAEPAEVPGDPSTRRTALDVVDPDADFPFSPLRRRGRASDTLKRADRALAALGETADFLLVYYGSDAAGGWQRLDAPLRTVTTLDRFAYVRPKGRSHEMRMLQVPELKRAMGMPQSFATGEKTRRSSIRVLGNAVCPPVMRGTVSSLRR